jgi:hypothetical protein
MAVVCPSCRSTNVHVEFDLYIPDEPRTIYEVYCEECGYEGDPMGVDVDSPREFDMTAAELEKVATQAIDWQNLHEEWALSTSPARKDIARFAWSSFVSLMRVLDQPSPHISKEELVKAATFPGEGDVWERTVGGLRLQRVVCPGGEWYSIV